MTFQSGNPPHLEPPENDTEIRFSTELPSVEPIIEEAFRIDADNSSTSKNNITKPMESARSNDETLEANNLSPSFFLSFPAIPPEHEESSIILGNNSASTEPSSSSFSVPAIATDPEDLETNKLDSLIFPIIPLPPASPSNVSPAFAETLNFLFANSPVESHFFFGGPEKQILTNVADKANLRQGQKFFFGPAKSEEQDFDEAAETTDEETVRKGQNNSSQLFINPTSFASVDQEETENYTILVKSTTEENTENYNSMDLDLASLFYESDGNSSESHYDYNLSGLYDEFLEEV